jgi:flagellar protein FlbB
VSAGSVFTNLLKIAFLLLLIVAIAFGGLFWFDHLGILDYNRFVKPFERYLPVFMRRGKAVTEDQLLLDKEFLFKEKEILEAEKKDLEVAHADLERRSLEIKELEAKLGEEAKRLDEEKKVLSEKMGAYDNYKDNIRKQAQYFTNMPPKAAVDRLSQLEDLLAIDILRQIDRNAEEQGRTSVVPYFLSLMDPTRAAVLQRKMTKTSGQE